MKALLISCCLLLASVNFLFAQKLSIGFHTGHGLSSYEDFFQHESGSFFQTKPVYSFSNSADIIFRYSPRVSFVSGASFEGKGADFYFAKRHSYYLTVPAALRLYVFRPDKRPLSAYIQGGIYGSYTLGSTKKSTGFPPNIDIPDLLYELRPYDFGWNGALGIACRINSRLNIDAQLQYSNGLMDIYWKNWQEYADRRRGNIALLARLGVEYSFSRGTK